MYPYSADAEWDYATKTIKTSLSHKQTGVVSSFADDVNIAVAKENGGSLVFKNLGTLIRFSITSSDVTAVVIKANNSEKLAGDVTIKFDASGNPSIDTDASGAAWSKVQLTPNGGGAFVPGTYNIVVLPFGLSDGLTVNVTKTDNKIYSKAKKTAATGDGGRVFELGTIDTGLTYDRDVFSQSAPTDKTLLYTTSQINAINAGTGTTLVAARKLAIDNGYLYGAYMNKYSDTVLEEDKATTDPNNFYAKASNPALLSLNYMLKGENATAAYRNAVGPKAVKLLTAWANACKEVEYTTRPAEVGYWLSMACFPWFVYYQYDKARCSAEQSAAIEAWFNHIADILKDTQKYLQSNDYVDGQYYSKEAVACMWGLVSVGYALGDMSIVKYALDDIDNPRDFYDCLQGCILMEGDTPCALDGNTVAPRNGEIYSRYYHTTASRGLENCVLTLQMLATVARSVNNAGGPNLFAYTCPTGENIELAYNFYAPIYANNDPDLQGGYYSGDRLGISGNDRHGLFELAYSAYPSNTAIQSVITMIGSNRASNAKSAEDGHPEQLAQRHAQLGYLRLLSADVDAAN